MTGQTISHYRIVENLGGGSFRAAPGRRATCIDSKSTKSIPLEMNSPSCSLRTETG